MDIKVERTQKISGALRMPGDKSIAHRALILGAAAEGEHVVTGLPASEDVQSTADCLRTLGCTIENGPGGRAVILTRKWAGGASLDAGNSGTTARLLSGLIAGKGLECTIDGDESLRRRPMTRVAKPLEEMGARVETAPGGRLPLRIRGGSLKGITFRPEAASAQVKSAILLAGLGAAGKTTVIEAAPTRDHTENLLTAMGVPVERENGCVSVRGGVRPRGIGIDVPGDVSSAVFFMVAASLLPGSEIRLAGVGVNPTRIGAVRVLQAMGADIEFESVRIHAGEEIADIIVRSGTLGGTNIDGAVIPTLIDELPILAVAATRAEGRTIVRDAGELRHKESDRIHAIVRNLKRLGAEIAEMEDGFVIHGPCDLQGATVSSYGDHRIAMSMAIAGLVAEGGVLIENAEVVGISYPGFFGNLEKIARR